MSLACKVDLADFNHLTAEEKLPLVKQKELFCQTHRFFYLCTLILSFHASSMFTASLNVFYLFNKALNHPSFHLLINIQDPTIKFILFQVQSIVDQHHPNVDAKTATKVRFQEPGAEGDNKNTVEPTNEVSHFQKPLLFCIIVNNLYNILY